MGYTCGPPWDDQACKDPQVKEWWIPQLTVDRQDSDKKCDLGQILRNLDPLPIAPLRAEICDGLEGDQVYADALEGWGNAPEEDELGADWDPTGDFEDVEPDVLAHVARVMISAVLEERGQRWPLALDDARDRGPASWRTAGARILPLPTQPRVEHGRVPPRSTGGM